MVMVMADKELAIYKKRLAEAEDEATNAMMSLHREIESLRSQLATQTERADSLAAAEKKEREHQRQLYLMKSEECQNQRDFAESWKRKCQRAEQERDEAKEKLLSFISDHELSKREAIKWNDEAVRLREANTAMREALETLDAYIDFEDLLDDAEEVHFKNASGINAAFTNARAILSRYTEGKPDTAPGLTP